MSNVLEIDTPEQLARTFGVRLERAAREAIAARGRCSLALAGGSATERFVPAWPAANVDWSCCDLYWVDERSVPPDDPESNFGLAWRRGLARLPLPEGRLHRLRAESGDLDLAAAAAEAELRAGLGANPRIDLALVGLGPDGHVASLFPGHAALAPTERWIVAVHDAPKPPARRLSWTLSTFALVDLLVVAALGEDKADGVLAAYRPEDSPLPIARAAARAARVLLLVDDGAARRLPRG